jgi:hypothetical protein
MLHSAATKNHRLENWQFADAAARAAAIVVSADIGKIAFQLDNKSYWRLTATTPTWEQAMAGPTGPTGPAGATGPTGGTGGTGGTGAGGGGGGGFAQGYTLDTANTSATDPGDGIIKTNNGSPALATALYISDVNLEGRFYTNYFTHQATGNYVILRDPAGPFIIFKITGTPTHTATGDGWTTIPVSKIVNDGIPVDGVLNPGSNITVEFSGPWA